MKVALVLCVYNEHALLQAFMKQLPPWISKIVVLASEFPWNGNKSDDDYKMWNILREMRDGRMEVWKLNWRTEHEQRNWGLGRCADYDFVLTMDADEFFTPEDWEVLYKLLPDLSLAVPCVVSLNMLTYWKTWDYVWEPQDRHKPVIAVNPKRAVFFDKRCLSVDEQFEARVTLHHLSWVKSDRDVLQKIGNWMHASDFDTAKWYTDVWKSWTPEYDGNLRPYDWNNLTKAIYVPLPDSIKAYFDGKLPVEGVSPVVHE